MSISVATFVRDLPSGAAPILRELLRGCIEQLLPADALMVAKVAEQSEREHITRMANLMGVSGGFRQH